MAEPYRNTFDFADGESELDSSFNVEYVEGGFALILSAEYASILFRDHGFVFFFWVAFFIPFFFILRLFSLFYLFGFVVLYLSFVMIS